MRLLGVYLQTIKKAVTNVLTQLQNKDLVLMLNVPRITIALENAYATALLFLIVVATANRHVLPRHHYRHHRHRHRHRHHKLCLRVVHPATIAGQIVVVAEVVL